MSTRAIKRAAVVIAVVATTSLPALAAAGAALGGRRAAVAGALLGLAALLTATLTAESGLMRVYGVSKAASGAENSLRFSLQRVIESVGGPSPAAVCFKELSPQALLIRGGFGPGVILVSEGLVGSLSEEELRVILTEGVLGLRRRGQTLRTVCVWLAHGLLSLAPVPWVELLFGELRWHEDLGVLSALRFTLMYSVARFLLRRGRMNPVDAPQLGRIFERFPPVANVV
jgi:heat shock protein HtpX